MNTVTVVDIFRSIHLTALKGEEPSRSSLTRDFGPLLASFGVTVLQAYNECHRASMQLARRISTLELFDLAVYGQRQGAKPFTHNAAKAIARQSCKQAVNTADYESWSQEARSRINALHGLCQIEIIKLLDELLASKCSRQILSESAYAQALQSAVRDAAAIMTGLQAYALASEMAQPEEMDKIISDHFTLSRLLNVI